MEQIEVKTTMHTLSKLNLNIEYVMENYQYLILQMGKYVFINASL